MNRKLLSVSLLLLGLQSYSQVGIGTLTPNRSAQLDVTSNNKGILIPRVGLTSSTDASTIQNGNVNSLLVFNTNTQNDVKPGYYYWYIDRWMRIVNDADVIALDKNTTNQSLTVIGSDLVLTDSDGNTVSVPLSAINIPTSVVKNPDGTYTFTNEAGDTVVIDATDNVINNIETILGDTNVLNELIEVLGNTYVGGNVYYDGTQFTYVDQSGTTHVINMQDIVKANETITTIVNNNDGTYTYTNEAGATAIIDVPAAVVNQFENIYNDIVNEQITVGGTTYNTFEEYLTSIANDAINIGGSTFIDVTGTGTAADPYQVSIKEGTANSMLITNAAGNVEWASLSSIVKANETVTTLVDNNNGTYTYTSENGTVTTVNIPASIVNQFNDIVNSGPVTVNGNTYTTIEEYLEEVVALNETVTNLTYDAATGIATYTNEAGTAQTIDLSDVVDNFETVTTVAVNNTTGTLTYVDESGVSTVLNLGDLVREQETLTSASFDAATGILTYNDEDGVATTLNLGAMVPNFETLTTVSVDNAAGTLTYVDEDGVSTVLDLGALVAANETVTTLVDNNNGTYTYTSENGTVTTVNIPASIVNQFNDIVNSGPVTVNGNTYTTIEEYLEDVVALNETVTNLTYDAATGIATYTNEAGTAQTIDLSDVVDSFETVTTVAVNNTTGTLTYVDESGVSTVLNLGDLVKEQETLTSASFDAATGILTYNDEDGVATTLNLGAMVPNFETLTTVSVDNAAGTLTYVDEDGVSTVLDLGALVAANETVTTLVDNNNGTYTYTSENGTVTTVNIPASIVNQFNDIVNSGPVTVNGNTYTTIEEYLEDVVALNETVTNLTYDAATGIATYTNEAGTAQTIDLSDVVDSFETVTTVAVNNTTGTLTYVDESGVSTVLNLGDLVRAQETLTSMVQNDATGVITYTPERGTPTTAEVVSADAGNEITVGTDGGAYYKPANTVASISASHTVSADDDTLLIDASGSGLTVTLPAAGDNNGRILILRKMDGSGNIITLSEQVTLANGVTFNQFNVQGTMRIQSNGTNWYKID
ncbi:hypothetical protein SAMN05421741_1433 [Paenimyroides ummariense]|uniref:YD repeat-containing protein n=1 Tax=Paenimyroides ummariense TaxID=913024 RepID=A0A1I5GKN2_9FLAO|nr:hypothetical protein [Paenimyroides ummariense]SFO36121.1 hypothetical protein SAMN05421741_1433 [Paenimyroides ummariense]